MTLLKTLRQPESLSAEAQQEFEQGIFRTFFILVFTSYIYVLYRLVPELAQTQFVPLFAASGYAIFSLLIVSSFVLFKQASVIRRTITLMGDNLIVLYGLASLGEFGAPLYTLMLLITIGYGVRFGVHYLYAATLFSNLGFVIVIQSVEFWLAHPFLSYTLLITNIIIPVFVSHLLNKLIIARQQAMIANEAKSQFLANMSHEIRTPLTGIIGLSEIMLSEEHAPATQHKIGTIEKSSKHLLYILNDILDFSKIEAGCLIIENRPFDLHAMISFVMQTYRSNAINKGLELHTCISPEIPYQLQGDQVRLNQVLMNLVSNAIKFTDTGNVWLNVKLLAQDHNIVKLRFEVIDTGIGIPEEKMASIFDRFSQADDSDSRRIGGTGLGMAISSDLIKLMGGKLQLESQLNSGSRFYFDLQFTAENEVDLTSFVNHSAVIFSKRQAFQNEITNYLNEWMLANEVFQDEEKLIVSIRDKETEGNSLLVILDAASLSATQYNLCRMIRRSTKKRVKLLLIESPGEGLEDCLEMDIDLSVKDIKEKHTIHSAIRTLLIDEILERSPESGKMIESSNIFSDVRVLIADDVEVNRYLLAQILNKLGARYVMAVDGQQALAYLQQEPFDIAIIDMQMPEVNGIEVIKRIKQTDCQNSQIPFIVLTANATQEALKKSESVGADAYLTKPIDIQRMIQSIDELLGSTRNHAIDRNLNHMSSDDNVDVLDLQLLDQLVRLGSDDEFVYKLIQKFKNETGNSISKMHSYLTRQEFTQLIDEAHAVKGAAANIGASQLAEYAHRMHLTKEDELISKGTSMLDQLNDAYLLVIRELEAYWVSNRHEGNQECVK